MNETEKRDRRDEKEEIRYHVIFYGQVQGVGFRYRAYYAAYQLGLTGWVKNLYDGSVEMEVEGEEPLIDELIIFLQNPYHLSDTGLLSSCLKSPDDRKFFCAAAGSADASPLRSGPDHR